MGAGAAPTFTADILPKFRPGDVVCMARHGVSLADVAWMTNPAGTPEFPDHAHARQVHARIASGAMPPDGRWPAEWVAAYEAWMDAGFQR